MALHKALSGFYSVPHNLNWSGWQAVTSVLNINVRPWCPQVHCLWTAESKVLRISDHCDGQGVDKALLVNNEKSAQRDANTARWLCLQNGKAEPKNFAPPQTPFPGAQPRRPQDNQNLTSWKRSLPSPTNPVW